jgi:hypothetical protein
VLSIRFDNEHEWWVPGGVFDRLFQSALDHGQLAPDLEEWRHVVDANGGISLTDLDPDVALALTMGLRAAATTELAGLEQMRQDTEDRTYMTSLEKLLTITREL